MTAELVCAASDRGAWLEARRTGVTATDIVTILGLNPWGSEYALFWEKLGKLPPWEGSPRTRLGQELEGYVGELFTDHYGGDIHPTGLYRSSARPWQMATPDRLWETPSQDDEPLELKTWDDHDRAAWEDGVPPRVRAQVLWQMDTLGVGTGHVGVLFLPSGEFESRTIEHSYHAPGDQVPADSAAGCPLCMDVQYMRQVGEAFWARVREGLPPFPDGSPATLAAVKALHAGVCAGQVELGPKLWDQFCDWKDELKQTTARVRQLESEVRVALGGAEVGTVGGEPVVKRTRYGVAAKAIERKAYTVDKLTRLGARNGDSDE